MTFEEGLNVFKYFLSQVYKNGKNVDNFKLMGMIGVYYTIFLIFHACLKFSVTKRKTMRAEICNFSITCFLMLVLSQIT